MSEIKLTWLDEKESNKKDSLEKHIHLERANDLKLKGLLGPSYQGKIVATTPIGRDVTKMVEKDKNRDISRTSH